MPINKNALVRYRTLDRCLSTKTKRFYIEDLIRACCDALAHVNGEWGAKGAEGVSRRQVFKDINEMEMIYGVLIDRVRDGRRIYYTYAKGSKTLRDSSLQQEEIDVVNDALQVLMRFEGMPQLDWINELTTHLYSTSQLGENTNKVVSFQNTPYLKGMDEWYKPIFNAIVNKRVIRIKYHPFGKDAKEVFVSPYHLKQYNNRWFLIGTQMGYDSLTNYAIDRIEDVEETSKKFEPLDDDFSFEDHFYDVVGVSVKENAPVYDVEILVNEKVLGYIHTKPIHPSQKRPVKQEDGRWLISLHVQDNYELRSQLRSFGEQIEVIAPECLRQEMKESSDKMSMLYADK